MLFVAVTYTLYIAEIQGVYDLGVVMEESVYYVVEIYVVVKEFVQGPLAKDKQWEINTHMI